MPKKTLKQWNASGKDFDDFFNPFDEVEEEVINNILYYTHARFDNGGFIQCPECQNEVSGIRYYMTFKRDGNKFYYLGDLPKFKQPKSNY